MNERQVIFSSAGRQLLGMLHIPDVGTRAGIVFCNAFGEERKCSHRTLVLLARELGHRGGAVLRFDYGGCGDSEGELRDATISSFEADISSAVEFLKQELSVAAVCLLGLRLGASLAARVAAARSDVSALLLLQPIVEGKAAFAADLKRKMVREMMLKGKSGGKRSDLVRELEQGDGEVDLDGFVVTGRLYRELMGIDVAAQVGSFSGRVLIAQIAASDVLRPETELLRDAYTEAGGAVTVLPAVAPPFWSRIEFIECGSLIERIPAWLCD